MRYKFYSEINSVITEEVVVYKRINKNDLRILKLNEMIPVKKRGHLKCVCGVCFDIYELYSCLNFFEKKEYCFIGYKLKTKVFSKKSPFYNIELYFVREEEMI